MEEKNFIFGRHPVIEAIESGRPIEKIMLLQGTRGEFEKTMRRVSKQNNIPLQYVPKERLNKYTRSNHQGVIAFASPIQYAQLSDIIPGLFEQQVVPLLLILDGISDIRNVGAIARSAEVMGVHALILPKTGGSMINSDAIKTSAGALSKLLVCRENSLLKAVGFLQNAGLQVLASDLNATTRLDEMDFSLPTAVIMGSESNGASPALLKAADQSFIIPQVGEIDSLNVSVATGVILYEAVQQRVFRGK